MKKRNWIRNAACLGAAFYIAILLVKPVGVSTQFSVLSGIFHSAVNENVITQDEDAENGYKSENEYYNRHGGKLAKSIKEPWNYDFVFVLAIPVGAALAYTLNRKDKRSELSDACADEKEDPHEQSPFRRYLPSFIGGFIILYGARMADGCTSGHMMSGMMQSSISGYIFAAAVFLTAIPTAIIIGIINGGKR
ncbi:MAG: YeeE/YedE thiosulfate transporter family protein [Oscillospiraceae bacterium]|nr:YeeE/YedE thiosulfate transporter family protein [Oscillospiraceae bacterium]